MDDIKVSTKKWKRTGNPNTNNKNIQPGYRNGIWHWKLCQADNEKSTKREIVEGIEQQNRKVLEWLEIMIEGKLLVLENIGNRPHQVEGDKRKKIRKEYLRRTKKLLKSKFYNRNLIKVINTRAIPLLRYLGPFLKWTR